jgi:hypothetical protein
MSFTSHTFTSLRLVHTPNPEFWGNVFDLASSWFASLLFIETSTRHNLRIWSSVDFWISQIPVPDLRRFATSGLCKFKIQIFADSRLQGFAGSRFQIFAGSRLQGFAGSRFQIFIDSRLRGFAGSRFQIFIDSTSLKTYFMNFVKPDVLRVTDFSWIPKSGKAMVEFRSRNLNSSSRLYLQHSVM